MVLFEPQWGSSVASTPWPPGLLRAYIREAKSRGLAVICDEIMCGLGRHGQEPKGATGCFLTECWELEPDCVTFGKSIGGGRCLDMPRRASSGDQSSSCGRDTAEIGHAPTRVGRERSSCVIRSTSGGGAGHLLSGAILLRGAETLAGASRTAYQSHTCALCGS